MPSTPAATSTIRADIANQNGIVFFPGSSPLYKTQILVGGFGISGDGVDQDDVVTFAGQQGFALRKTCGPTDILSRRAAAVSEVQPQPAWLSRTLHVHAASA